MTTTLAAVPPFDLRQSVRAMAGFSPCVGEQLITDDSVRKAFAVDARRAVVLDVGAHPDGITVTTHGDAEPDWVARTVTNWLGLADDVSEFLAIARAEPQMRDVLAATAGLHHLRFGTLAEGATYFVLTQRTPQRTAGSRKRRLAAIYGPRLTVDGEEHIAFPTLDALAGLSTAELEPFCANARQVEHLASTLAGVAQLGEEWLRAAPYAEAKRALLQLRGVGEFTASAILLRALGRTDEVPLEMTQFAEVVTAIYGPAKTLEEVRRAYGRHVGLWSYFAKTGMSWLGTPTTHKMRRSA
jgi:DNA-3-methyladenine glycosylase II